MQLYLVYDIFMMTNMTYRIVVLLILQSAVITCFAKSINTDINPDQLIKVTPSINAKCVEYYNYKGELYCSTTALNPQPIDPHLKDHEKLNIVFDDRPWQAAWGQNGPEVTMIEYVPKGGNVEHWDELVTSQFLPNLQQKATPKEFAQLFIKKLNEAGYKPIVTYHLDNKDRVIFEYQISQPENQRQDELQMITQDNQGLYVLHYVIKKTDMGEDKRNTWIQNFKNTSIKK